MLVSIIIPIYNVGKWLPRCLDSIYGQQVDESLYEIIAVNDGSSDNSAEVIKSYQILHNNITLLEQPNGGVSSARNNGIERSTGKYLVFVDPDDTLLDNSLFDLLSLIENQENDVIVMRSYRNDSKESYGWEGVCKSGDSVGCIDVINRGYVRGSVCGVGYRRDFITRNSIRFPLGVRNCEDVFFFFLCMGYCEELYFVDIKFYNVIGRENSASNVYSVDRLKYCVYSVNLANTIIEQEHNIKRVELYNFLKFVLILNTLTTALHTPAGSLSLLKKYGLSRYRHIKCTMITYKKLPIRMINFSITMPYFALKLLNR